MNQIDIPGLRNILLAEDDEDFFYFFKSAVLSLSSKINVLRTSNGAMLLSLVETSIQPDVIFLDINMPFKNGTECLLEIRRREKYKKTKVIMCSSLNTTEEINASYENGADHYLVKPGNISSLIKQFKNLVRYCGLYPNGRPPREKFVLT